MLVLTGKVGEEIVIRNNIRLTVVAIEGEHVRIGISAPQEGVLDRQEVREKGTNFFTEGPTPSPTLNSPSRDVRPFPR